MTCATALLAFAQVRAEEIYVNDFSRGTASLDSVIATALGSAAVTVEDGQLKISPGPTYLNRGFITVNLPALSSAYTGKLAELSAPLTIAFNVANSDGVLNNQFSTDLFSTADGQDETGLGYSLSGGGFVGDGFVFSENAVAFSPVGPVYQELVSSANGPAPLPNRGAFRLRFDPVASTWSVYSETGTTVVDPMSIPTLVGSAASTRFVDRSLPYVVFSSQNTGAAYFDNITVALGNGPTFVGGSIPTDTTWTLANSPYIVTDTITVATEATLTIEPGVRVIHRGGGIVIHGALVANGTEEAPVVFTPASTGFLGVVSLLFDLANLSTSHLEHVRMNSMATAIRISRGGNFDPAQSCTGTLEVGHSTFVDADLRTAGFDAGGKLVLRNCSVSGGKVVGQYGRSEAIELTDTTLIGVLVSSESFNDGVLLTDCIATACTLRVGLGRSNLVITASDVSSSAILADGPEQPANGSVTITDSYLVDTPLVLPAATLVLERSFFGATQSFPAPALARVGQATINDCVFVGNGGLIGIDMNGDRGIVPLGSLTISGTSLTDCNIGLRVASVLSASCETGNTFLRNASYGISNQAAVAIPARNNFWGTVDPGVIAAAIFDFSDASTSGIVDASQPTSDPRIFLSNVSRTYDGAPQPVAVATTPPGLEVDITYDGAPAAPSTGGAYLVYAVSSDEAYPGRAGARLVVARAPQTISVDNFPAVKSTLDAPFPLTATASSGLPVNCGITSGAATVEENTVSLSNVPGTIVIRFSQEGNDNYLPAPDVVLSFPVQTPPAIVTPPVGGTFVAHTSFALSVNATGTDLVYQWQRNGAPLTDNPNRSGSTLALLTHTGISTIGFDGQYTVTVSNRVGTVTSDPVTVVVNKANQTIMVEPVADRTATDNPFALAAAASWGLPVTFDLVSGPASIAGNIVTLTGVGTVTFRASQAGDLDNNPAQSDASFDVVKASASVSISNTAQAFDGASKPVIVTTNPAGLSVTITYDGSLSAPSGFGSYEVVAIVTDAIYEGLASTTLVIAPGINSGHPGGATVTDGGPTSLTVGSAGTGPETTYQWQIEIPVSTPATLGSQAFQWIDIPGATAASHLISSTQRFNAGRYRVIVTTNGNTVTSLPFLVTVEAPPPNTARLLNLSTRGLAGADANQLFPGFVVSGSGTKKLLIRAVGPSLGDLGVPFATLPDPRMELKRFNFVTQVYEDLEANDDWGSNTNAAAITSTAAQVFAFPYTDPADAALLVDLPAGQYAVVGGDKDGTSAIGMVELYDADVGTPSATLINISNRGFCGVGDSVMIPGFVISSEGPKTLLVRVVGPTLGGAPYNVPGTMNDPKLEIYPSGANLPILANDNWGDNPDAAYTAQIAQQVSAFPLAAGGADAAFVVTLPPGGYTIVGSSAIGGGTGVVLVEVYVVP